MDMGLRGVMRLEDGDAPSPEAGELSVPVAANTVNPVDYMIRSGAVSDCMPVAKLVDLIGLREHSRTLSLPVVFGPWLVGDRVA